MSPSSLLEKIASIREGSSCGTNARLTKRLQAGMFKPKKKESGVISLSYKIGKGGRKAYHSRMQRFWRCHGVLQTLSGGQIHLCWGFQRGHSRLVWGSSPRVHHLPHRHRKRCFRAWSGQRVFLPLQKGERVDQKRFASRHHQASILSFPLRLRDLCRCQEKSRWDHQRKNHPETRHRVVGAP